MVRDGYVHMNAVPEEARRGHRSPGTRVTGSYELSNQSVGNQTRVLCSSLILSQLSTSCAFFKHV